MFSSRLVRQRPQNSRVVRDVKLWLHLLVFYNLRDTLRSNYLKRRITRSTTLWSTLRGHGSGTP